MNKTLKFFTFLSIALVKSLFAGTFTADMKVLGVTPKIEKRTSARLNNLEYPQDRYFLQIKLGKLSRAQFLSLMNRYGNYSKVSYNSSRDYELIDFLPPVMQALNGKTFQNSYIPVSSRSQEISFIFKNGVSVASNCFNTTFEILRSLQSEKLELKHRFFIPDRWSATALIQNSKIGQSVTPPQIRPYDVLFYIAKEPMGMRTLQHTAIYLSDDLVFEKTDSSEHDPYRISFAEDVKSKYRKLLPEMFESHQLLTRRFGGKGKAMFPDLKVGIEHAPFSEPSMINKLPAALKRMNLSIACETGLGGGCDMNIYDVQDSQLAINPTTGRGEIISSQAVLRRLMNL